MGAKHHYFHCLSRGCSTSCLKKRRLIFYEKNLIHKRAFRIISAFPIPPLQFLFLEKSLRWDLLCGANNVRCHEWSTGLLTMTNDAHGISLSARQIGVVMNCNRANKLAVTLVRSSILRAPPISLVQIQVGSEGVYLLTHPAGSSVTESAVTLVTVPSTVAIGWQRLSLPKVASVSAVPVQPPPLK